MREERFCTNCRAEIPDGGDTCPACGVFAGDLFDGRIARAPRKGRWGIALMLILVLTATTGWLILQRRSGPEELTTAQPVHVVSDRPGGTRRAPGAALNEAEAIRILRRHLVSTGISSECVAISSQGPRGGAYRLTAINRCEETRLGRFAVDGKSGDVTRDRQ